MSVLTGCFLALPVVVSNGEPFWKSYVDIVVNTHWESGKKITITVKVIKFLPTRRKTKSLWTKPNWKCSYLFRLLWSWQLIILHTGSAKMPEVRELSATKSWSKTAASLGHSNQTWTCRLHGEEEECLPSREESSWDCLRRKRGAKLELSHSTLHKSRVRIIQSDLCSSATF